jgi:hypothetical protein
VIIIKYKMAISVDKVYKKVLSILNKESRGFLTPDEFSKIASIVQLDLLDKAFHDYNRAIARQNLGRGGVGYSNIPNKIKNRIDPFYATSSITLSSGVGSLPTTTVDSYTRSSVYNIVRVTTQDNNSLNITEVDRVEKSKLSYLLSSPMTTPSTTFPIYYITGENINVNPNTLSSVDIDYISVPSNPVWNSTTDENGALTYSSTGSVDFTLHSSSEVDLILGILRYAGVVIKDPSVIQAVSAEATQKIQQENA